MARHARASGHPLNASLHIAWRNWYGMNHQFTMSNSALLQRVSRGEARQTYEMAVMRPNLAGASFEGNQGNLKVENSGTVNLQVAGELREALHEPVTRIQHLRAGFAQLGQKGPRLLCLRRPGGGGRMGDHSPEFSGTEGGNRPALRIDAGLLDGTLSLPVLWQA